MSKTERSAAGPNAPEQSVTEQWLEQARALEAFPIVAPSGERQALGELSEVALRPRPRYGVFEQDGSEMVAGIVHLQAGANPLEATREVLAALQTIGDELPERLRLSPCYDRTALITGSVATVTRTLVEALLVTTLGIVLIMRHLRTSLVIAVTLPLAVLGAFLGMRLATAAGWSLHTNIMSLAGIAISIGVLVDAAVVVVENVTHRLKDRFGDRPVTGDTDRLVAEATAMVARPAVLAILIMLVSFLPIFALRGIDGHMYRPLAWTKSLTLLSVILLTVTVVPALCRLLIRGRLRSEQDSSIMRAVMRVYRPVLVYLFERPWPLVAMLGCLLIAAVAATGLSWLLPIATLGVVAAGWSIGLRMRAKIGLTVLFIGLALAAQATMRPIRLALRLPLDEGMVMDMPITVPRMTVSQAADDLKARNMLLCRFPEVRMVTGKAGRADTAFDPAPIDMIESMVEFRPRNAWPRRRLLHPEAARHAALVVREMVTAGLVEPPADEPRLVEEIVDAGLQRFNAAQRELCWQLLQPFEKSLSQELTLAVAKELSQRWHRAGVLEESLAETEVSALASQVSIDDQILLAKQLDPNSVHIVIGQLCRGFAETHGQDAEDLRRAAEATRSQVWSQIQSTLFASSGTTLAEEVCERSVRPIAQRRWRKFVAYENQTLYGRVGRTWTQIVADELCMRQPILDERFARVWEQILAARYATSTELGAQVPGAEVSSTGTPAPHHGGDAHDMTSMPSVSKMPIIDPHATYDRLITSLSERLGRSVWLWPHDQESLAGASGELDAAVRMPGWANVWTRPIQNRIDMLATGVNSEVGVRVLGDDQKKVVDASEQIAEILRHIPGAADVIADPIRDKDYMTPEIDFARIDRERLSRSEVQLAIAAAMDGHVVEPAVSSALGSGPVRLLLRSPSGSQHASLLDTPLPLHKGESNEAASASKVSVLPLRELATLRYEIGPATIKSTGGRLSNYVRLNVIDRDATEWVKEAQAVLARASLPPDVSIEWTGQFEHAARTRAAMLWIVPGCVALILILLFAAFRDVADALLMVLSVPGALAGAVLMQWLLGFPFSLAVGVGYITCFGMAAATSMVMLVYLRQAVAEAGGLENLPSLDGLRDCVVSGAVHRLRPKLLTEATMILGLAPLMWNTGVGADVIRPMAAPVLGGILVADEVVDLLIPVVFFAIRRRRWSRRVLVDKKVAA
ncbi:MAG: efflux RND transporter permease subunit [Aureliella sp.]